MLNDTGDDQDIKEVVKKCDKMHPKCMVNTRKTIHSPMMTLIHKLILNTCPVNVFKK